jgi:hypothetical protein
MRPVTLIASLAFLKQILESKMTKSQHRFLTAILMTAVPIAASFALSSPALSATCGGMTNNCIQRNNAQGRKMHGSRRELRKIVRFCRPI